jgi:hypothetical protein
MKNTIDPKEWAEEFKNFVESPVAAPPAQLRDAIFSEVHHDLNPGLWLVLAKLGSIHVVVGSLSLLLCSQFGMGRGDFMMRTFMGYGMPVCMAFCGALFLGLTTLVAGFALTSYELRTIRRTGYAPVWMLGTVSLLVFWNFGAETAVAWAASWLLGAGLAGIVLTETSIAIKRFVRLAA